MTARSVAVCIGSCLVTVAVGCAENPVPPVPVAVVDVNGVSLPYEVAGDGPPLVLIHGWAWSATTVAGLGRRRASRI